jgi:CheY-like chemotaxis protein
LVTGRKLLLADDSVTIQKVVALTFTDEGLEVVTVSDGQQALEKLDEFTPDIVLADVFMPHLNGYQLCEHIRRTERLSHIPVMLLVGSFEPFDEAEARRVGADDYLTKPFQSIRTLIGKVRNLLSGGGAERAEAATQRLVPPPEAEKENRPDSDFLERSTADTAPLPDVEEDADQHVSHSREISFADLSMDDEMIETTPASDYSSAGQARPTVQYSAADLKEAGIAQVVGSESAAPQPETVSSFAAVQASEPQHQSVISQAQAAPPASSAVASSAAASSAAASSDDALLDLGDIESPSAAATEADDFFLDLFDESPQPAPPAAAQPVAESFAPVSETGEASIFEETDTTQAQEFVEGQVVDADAPTAPIEEEAATIGEPQSSSEEVSASAQPETYRADLNTAPTERLPDDYHLGAASAAPVIDASYETPAAESTGAQTGKITLDQLSPEVIDAIARRAVELLSEHVIEEIAWEVVPQLAELLIKRKLNENSSQ